MRWSNLQTAIGNMREWVRVTPLFGFTVNLSVLVAAIWLMVYVDSYAVFGVAAVFGLLAAKDILSYVLGRLL